MKTSIDFKLKVVVELLVIFDKAWSVKKNGVFHASDIEFTLTHIRVYGNFFRAIDIPWERFYHYVDSDKYVRLLSDFRHKGINLIINNNYELEIIDD